MLSYVMLCYAMLYYTILCYAMLDHIKLTTLPNSYPLPIPLPTREHPPFFQAGRDPPHCGSDVRGRGTGAKQGRGEGQTLLGAAAAGVGAGDSAGAGAIIIAAVAASVGSVVAVAYSFCPRKSILEFCQTGHTEKCG
jgi:hypothetical protein